MTELCREQIKSSGFESPAVAMVDHGTPLPEVNQVREDVGQQMKERMGSGIARFSTCAMERRPDPQYDFNDPLLENLLQKWMNEGIREVVVSQFFLLPGRHAGPGGGPCPDLPAVYRSGDENLPDRKSWIPFTG